MKVGLSLLLALTFLVTTGAFKTANASVLNTDTQGTGNCSSSLLLDSPICFNTPNSCVRPQVTSAPQAAQQNNPADSAALTSLPKMPELNSEYASDSAVLDSNKIFDLVNEFRASQGLAAFEKNDDVCNLAQTRSTEIPSEISRGVLHSGLYNRGLSYWIFENAKYGSNEEGTVAWWLASPIHHKSIVADYKYSCVKCTGSYCSELFTSFAPKNANLAAAAPKQ